MINLILDQHTTNVQPPFTGHWQSVRLCFDLVTQEWINIGILFTESTGERHSRFVENFDGIRCLYNEDVVDTCRFLMEQAEYALETNSPIPAGWNIQLGPKKYIQGKDPDAILNDIFSRIVPLGRHKIGVHQIDREDHPHATINVRKSVRQLLNKHLQLAKSSTPEFWRSQPIPIRRDGADIHVDVQIAGISSNVSLYGAVSSAWYKTRYHRNASLSQSVNALSTAGGAFPNSQRVLYLLKPPADASNLSKEDHQAISADIESSSWLLGKHGATLNVVQDETELALLILNDLGLISEIS